MRSSASQARWEVGESGGVYAIDGPGEGESVEANIVPVSCVC